LVEEVDDSRLNAVLAHSMLGTLAAIRGAVQTLITYPTIAERDPLLEMAIRRIDFLSDQVRDLALGLPDEIVTYLAELRREEPEPTSR
jgi:hypothetical protein